MLHECTLQHQGCCALLTAGVHAQTISLKEALTGVSAQIQHLDKRTLVTSSSPGQVIKPESWQCINDEGMPAHGRPFEKGNLYITFHVKFPETLNSDIIMGLKNLLPGPSANGAMDVDDDHEEVGAHAIVLQWLLCSGRRSGLAECVQHALAVWCASGGLMGLGCLFCISMVSGTRAVHLLMM